MFYEGALSFNLIQRVPLLMGYQIMLQLHHFFVTLQLIGGVYLESNLYNFRIMRFLQKPENELNAETKVVSGRTIHN